MTINPLTIAAFDFVARTGDADALADADPAVIFTTGGCALYAAALLKANPGWGVIAAGQPDCLEWDKHPDDRTCSQYGFGLCDCKTAHFYALSPEGWLYDVNGEHDPIGVQQDHALWGVPDESLAAVIESWHLNGEQIDYDAAALAERLTARPTAA